MINPKEFTKALQALEETKNIPQDVVISALKVALMNAYQKENGKDALVRVEIDPKKTFIEMFNQKMVVEEVNDDFLEISLEDAKESNPDYKIGDIYETPIDTNNFDRMAALHVKQILKQKIREAEKQVVYDEYIGKKDDIVIGEVERIEKNYCLINIGKTSALLPNGNMIPGEKYYPGQHVKVYINEVDKTGNGAQVVVSRNAPGFLKRLFESEIMEVYDGTVEIRAIAREPGERAKVAVSSKDKNVDAAGACIGQKGMRIQKITAQLGNEKIDVINYFEAPELFIAEALKPATVYGMTINEDERSAIVIVPNEEFSLAIGKKGQNARLAVKLTKWRIDIKSIDTAHQEKIHFISMNEIIAKYAKGTTKVVEKELEIPVVEVAKDEQESVIVQENKIETIVKKVETKTPTPEPVIEVAPVIAEVKPAPVEVKVEVKPVVEKIEVKLEPKTDGLKPQIEIELEKAAAEQKAAQRASEIRRAKMRKDIAEEQQKIATNPSASYMPVYTAEELKELEEIDKQKTEKSKYDEDIDYDEFDEYYDK